MCNEQDEGSWWCVPYAGIALLFSAFTAWVTYDIVEEKYYKAETTWCIISHADYAERMAVCEKIDQAGKYTNEFFTVYGVAPEVLADMERNKWQRYFSAYRYVHPYRTARPWHLYKKETP